MDPVIWKESYSVKVASCDDDHKKLIAIINSLQKAMAQGQGAVAVQSIVEKVMTYARAHFSAEESLMEASHYPDLVSHREEHRKFLIRMEQFQQDLAAGKFVSSVPVDAFLSAWFTKHVTQVDQQYSTYLDANGIS